MKIGCLISGSVESRKDIVLKLLKVKKVLHLIMGVGRVGNFMTHELNLYRGSHQSALWNMRCFEKNAQKTYISIMLIDSELCLSSKHFNSSYFLTILPTMVTHETMNDDRT